MNESEKFITTGVFSHERNTSGNCSVSGCPCRGWSAQESVNEHGHEPVARGGESERVILNSDLVVRPLSNTTKFLLATEDDWPIAEFYREEEAEGIAYEHNQHHSLLAERERLREAATKALAAFRYMRDVDTQWWDFHVTPEICTAWDKLRAALNDQKGE